MKQLSEKYQETGTLPEHWIEQNGYGAIMYMKPEQLKFVLYQYRNAILPEFAERVLPDYHQFQWELSEDGQVPRGCKVTTEFLKTVIKTTHRVT